MATATATAAILAKRHRQLAAELEQSNQQRFSKITSPVPLLLRNAGLTTPAPLLLHNTGLTVTPISSQTNMQHKAGAAAPTLRTMLSPVAAPLQTLETDTPPRRKNFSDNHLLVAFKVSFC